MERLVEEIINRLSRIEEKVDSISVTSATQGEQLKEHMRRTQIAEESIELLRVEIKPIQKHVDLIHGIGGFFVRILVVTGGLIGLFEAVRRLFV